MAEEVKREWVIKLGHAYHPDDGGMPTCALRYAKHHTSRANAMRYLLTLDAEWQETARIVPVRKVGKRLDPLYPPELFVEFRLNRTVAHAQTTPFNVASPPAFESAQAVRYVLAK